MESFGLPRFMNKTRWSLISFNWTSDFPELLGSKILVLHAPHLSLTSTCHWEIPHGATFEALVVYFYGNYEVTVSIIWVNGPPLPPPMRSAHAPMNLKGLFFILKQSGQYPEFDLLNKNFDILGRCSCHAMCHQQGHILWHMAQRPCFALLSQGTLDNPDGRCCILSMFVAHQMLFFGLSWLQFQKKWLIMDEWKTQCIVQIIMFMECMLFSICLTRSLFIILFHHAACCVNSIGVMLTWNIWANKFAMLYFQKSAASRIPNTILKGTTWGLLKDFLNTT